MLKLKGVKGLKGVIKLVTLLKGVKGLKGVNVRLRASPTRKGKEAKIWGLGLFHNKSFLIRGLYPLTPTCVGGPFNPFTLFTS